MTMWVMEEVKMQLDSVVGVKSKRESVCDCVVIR